MHGAESEGFRWIYKKITTIPIDDPDNVVKLREIVNAVALAALSFTEFFTNLGKGPTKVSDEYNRLQWAQMPFMILEIVAAGGVAAFSTSRGKVFAKASELPKSTDGQRRQILLQLAKYDAEQLLFNTTKDLLQMSAKIAKDTQETKVNLNEQQKDNQIRAYAVRTSINGVSSLVSTLTNAILPTEAELLMKLQGATSSEIVQARQTIYPTNNAPTGGG